MLLAKGVVLGLADTGLYPLKQSNRWGVTMQRAGYIAFALGVVLTCPAFAATIELVNGKVLINHGDGFLPTLSGAQANPGDLVMASAGGSAKLVYPGGCQVKVIPGSVVSVGKQPPCTASSLAGLEEVPPEKAYFTDPLLPFAITAAAGWGIYCATIWCREHHNGGGNKPASP